jgi:hypothetical protein
LHQFFAQIGVAQGIVIAMGNVVAFTQPAPSDHHTVLSIGEGSEDEFEIDPTRTHDPDEPDVIRIL